MANEWADKDLPRAQRNIAPAVYDENKEEWVVVLGRDGRQFVRDDSVERQLKELNETMGGNMDVSDKDVKAELQSIKDTQGQIINALKQTNEALKGTINTQLTGSYVEDGLPVKSVDRFKEITILDGETIPANTSVISRNVETGQSFRVLVKVFDGKNPEEIVVSQYAPFFGSGSRSEAETVSGAGNGRWSKIYTATTKQTKFFIKNTSPDDDIRVLIVLVNYDFRGDEFEKGDYWG